MTKPHVSIHTDGGCKPNPGPGGWAALLRFGEHEKELSGGAAETTNNRMELTAAIKALHALKKPCTVDFYTDSIYLKNGITRWLFTWARNGWMTKARTPVKNQDLWQCLYEATQRHEIEWHWLKSHAGNEYNERVDRLAGAARQPFERDET